MSATEPDRLAWIDVAKGIGILLVVLGHAIGGMVDAGLIDKAGPWGQAWTLIYSFHMPLFFLLSGLFAPRSVERSTPQFLRTTAERIVWPYLLWSSVQLAVLAATAAWINTPASASLGRWVALLWTPISQFWFLYVLAIFQIGTWLLLPRIGRIGMLWLGLGLLMLPGYVDLPPILNNVCRFGLFFALGMLAPGLAFVRLSKLEPVPALWRALPVLALTGLTGMALIDRGLSAWSPQALPAALLGILGCVLLAIGLTGAAARWLQFLGRASMAIFLLHILFGSGTRIVLNRLFKLTDANLVLAAVVVVGVAGPLLVERLVRARGLQRWAGLGR